MFFYLLLSVGIDTAFGQRLGIFLTHGDNHGNPGSTGITYWTDWIVLLSFEYLSTTRNIDKFYIMNSQQLSELQ